MSKAVLVYNLLAGPGVSDPSKESNMWHVRNYEFVFDKVYVLFLASTLEDKKVIRNGKTIAIAIGSKSLFGNIFFSPFRLYRIAKRVNPSLLVTYEQVFVWWILFKVNLFRRIPNMLIPIAFPETVYKTTGKSLSQKLPIWFEKILRRWSFRKADKIVTTKNLDEYQDWLLSDRIAAPKTIIFNKLPEEIPPFIFLKNAGARNVEKLKQANTFNLLIIGRLLKEKLTDHAILALAELLSKDKRYRLSIIGEGEQQKELEDLAKKLNIREFIRFEGYKNSKEIIEVYSNTHVVVSPYTGGSLRETALLKVPIAAYATDWLIKTLVADKEYAAAEFLNYKQLAEQIEKLASNYDCAIKLAENMYCKAVDLWTPQGLKDEYETFFETIRKK